jgi:hypothetical protein
VVTVAERVTTVLETFLRQNIREEEKSCSSETADSCSIDMNVFGDNDLNLELFYVDAHRMSRVLADLLVSLRLATNSYSFFVLNPQSPVDTATAAYGYRAGFSQAELDEIWRARTQLPVMHVEHVPSSKIDSQQYASMPLSPTPAPAGGQQRGSEGEERARHIDRRVESARWADLFSKRVAAAAAAARNDGNDDDGGGPERFTAAQQRACTLGDADDLACLFRVAPPSADGAVALANEVATFGSVAERRYLATALSREYQGLENGVVSDDSAGSMLQADPLVDAWTSTHRFAFLDLTAGPFEWGPTVARSGVKTYDSMPRTPSKIHNNNNNNNDSVPLFWQNNRQITLDQRAADNERGLLEAMYHIHCVKQEMHDSSDAQVLPQSYALVLLV